MINNHKCSNIPALRLSLGLESPKLIQSPTYYISYKILIFLPPYTYNYTELLSIYLMKIDEVQC